MRLWEYRVSLQPAHWTPGCRRSDYMELAFPTRREAHEFAFDLLDDPLVLRVVCTDSAGRADTLTLRGAAA